MAQAGKTGENQDGKRGGKQGGKFMSLDELVRQLHAAHGAALRCVVLYGSAAAGEDIAGQSDLNVIALSDSLDTDRLRVLAQTMRAWQEAGNHPVLQLTPEEWRGSADIFPMEYADILERHRVLYGVLPLDGITVSRVDLRLQVEREAMGRLLQLRRSIMVAGTSAERQRELLTQSIGTMLVIFRAVIRLSGQVPERDTGQVIASVSQRCGFDSKPFLLAQSLKQGAEVKDSQLEDALSGYLAGMTTLVRYLDSLPAT